MSVKTETQLLEASVPSEIFSMNAGIDVVNREYEDYLERFKPSAYNTVRNFVITQRVTILYRKAVNMLEKKDSRFDHYNLVVTSKNGQTLSYEADYVYDIRLGKMYVTENDIIFIVYKRYKSCYENYIDKASHIPKLNKKLWSNTQYSFPDVSYHFETDEGDYAIILTKPCKIYPLREVLNYFSGKMYHEHVTAIINRLCYFECYMDIIGTQHNGITVDSLFFAPGRVVNEGEEFTVNDMRIVGVFGGWFYSTYSNEQRKYMPKEVNDALTPTLQKRSYSSFEVDILAIKKVARELLGDVTGSDLKDAPEPLKAWVTSSSVKAKAYDEYVSFEDVIHASYGKRRFVDMDISIK